MLVEKAGEAIDQLQMAIGVSGPVESPLSGVQESDLNSSGMLTSRELFWRYGPESCYRSDPEVLKALVSNN